MSSKSKDDKACILRYRENNMFNTTPMERQVV